MAQALRLAERGRASTHPNPRVGCVIVKNGKLIAEGFHERAGDRHAEINALREAGDKARGAEVFVTLEPCCHTGRTGPCTQALLVHKPHKVWVAMQDPNPLVGFALKNLGRRPLGFLQSEELIGNIHRRHDG